MNYIAYHYILISQGQSNQSIELHIKYEIIEFIIDL